MVANSINGHEKLGKGIKESVWFEGTTALLKGEGVCHNDDYGTAADADGRRYSRVERPTVSNSRSFAGVAVQDYSAKTGPQLIEIYVPGSKSVPVALGESTVIGTGMLTFCVSGRYNIGVSTGLGTEAGRFHTGKFTGRGSAIPRQTVTLDEASMIGAWSLATDGVTLTVVATAGLAAGDSVFLLGGEDDGTGTVIPGRYLISSVTDATTLVLAASAVDTTPGGALTCTGYANSGNPTAICDLLEGDESGGVEFINLPNAGGDTQPHMLGGVSYVCGGLTLAADAEVELAQGTRIGEKKAFVCLGTMTTSDFVVDLVTAGVQIDGSTALAENAGFDAALDASFLEFRGARWFCTDIVGGATQA